MANLPTDKELREIPKIEAALGRKVVAIKKGKGELEIRFATEEEAVPIAGRLTKRDT